MKTFFQLLISTCIYVCFFFGTPILQAQAQEQLSPQQNSYACILSDDVFFYSEQIERSGLFLLPKSYYVKILEYGEKYCKIEYGDESLARPLTGYAKTEMLTFVEYIPRRPYLSYTFDVAYTIENGSITDSAFLTQITINCIYYGDYKIGSEVYCYILRGEEFGYIPKPATLSYEENYEYADYVNSLKESSNPPSSEPHSSPTQVGILVALCFLVPLLASLILKPSRRSPYNSED